MELARTDPRFYTYKVAGVVRVVDGDTVDLQLDLGFHTRSVQRFRLLNVDTPERGQPGWAECTDFLKFWLATHSNLTALTFKTDSFGRWLALIVDGEGEELFKAINEFMADIGGSGGGTPG
jgi:micrococcal nuclease